MKPYTLYLIEAGIFLFHALGILQALHAIKHVRTSQGAIAWAVAQISFPYVAVPAYWIFGRGKFFGYVEARRAGILRINHIAQELWHRLADFKVEVDEAQRNHQKLYENLARLPATRGNALRLLVDGPETFDAIFDAISRAQHYVLVQFFIVNDDELGRDLQINLIERARAGVKVYFLYDEIGSRKLPARYLAELRAAGVQASAFNSTRGRRNRFQLNFRNHRKITVVDGAVGFVGGHNAGDEYMGRDPRFGPWRDTHVQVAGPAVTCVQLAFLEDWYWATQQVPDLNWQPVRAEHADQRVLVLPTGPADNLDSCAMFFTSAIMSARERLWISSPYFVPDDGVVRALQVAALRGVDVRIMLPQKPDHLLVYLSAFSYYAEMELAGVKIYRYQPGFMHQKVMLVDGATAAVGTANLDNRSFRLNFEITMLVHDSAFAGEVERMLERDFSNCRLVHSGDLRTRSILFRVLVRIARLLAPIQ